MNAYPAARRPRLSRAWNRIVLVPLSSPSPWLRRPASLLLPPISESIDIEIRTTSTGQTLLTMRRSS